MLSLRKVRHTFVQYTMPLPYVYLDVRVCVYGCTDEVAVELPHSFAGWEWDKIYVCNYIEIKVEKFL